MKKDFEMTEEESMDYYSVTLPKEELKWLQTTGKVKMGKIISLGILIKDPVDGTFSDCSIAHVATAREACKAHLMVWVRFTLPRFYKKFEAVRS